MGLDNVDLGLKLNDIKEGVALVARSQDNRSPHHLDKHFDLFFLNVDITPLHTYLGLLVH